MYHQSLPYHDFLKYAVNVCRQKNAFWADTVTPHPVYGRYSFVCGDAYHIFKPDDFNHHDIFEQIKSKLPYHDYGINIPFQGGFAGFFSYNYGKKIFDIPCHKPSLVQTADYYGGLYDCVLYAHHDAQIAGCFAVNTHPEYTPKQRVEWCLNLPDYAPVSVPVCDIIPTDDADDYIKSVNNVRGDIAKGTIFQANIARYYRGNRPDNFNPLDFYLKLRDTNPSPFGCFMECSDIDFSLISSSPERFISIKDNLMETRPIKGTLSDKFPKDDLKNNPKDYAENVMITDLLRNDLSISAVTGTVNVTQLCDVETYKGLHHLVSVVQAKKRPDLHPIDVFKNAFAGGSVTGAPKKRAMEIISHYEHFERGAYCGSAGYISHHHNMDMNILIRTVTADKNHIGFGTGCGITYMSDADSEYQESLLKADKIIKSFQDK